MQLHGFFRSGTSHRLRIALNLKRLSVQQLPVDLRSGEHLRSEFKRINPQGLVPVLVDDDGQIRTQTPSIIEWLEEIYPQPPLLPRDHNGRARVRALAAIVGCDVHPLNNRRVLEALRRDFGAEEADILRWCTRWISDGFDAYEAILASDRSPGTFSFGDAPTLADVCLVPQVESARRFKVDLNAWPRIRAVDEACRRLEAFRLAEPALQPDAA